MTTVQYEKVSVSELGERLDALARQHLNLSGDEFIARCRARTLDMTSPIVSRLALIGRLFIEASDSNNGKH